MTRSHLNSETSASFCAGLYAMSQAHVQEGLDFVFIELTLLTHAFSRMSCMI